MYTSQWWRLETITTRNWSAMGFGGGIGLGWREANTCSNARCKSRVAARNNSQIEGSQCEREAKNQGSSEAMNVDCEFYNNKDFIPQTINIHLRNVTVRLQDAVVHPSNHYWKMCFFTRKMHFELQWGGIKSEAVEDHDQNLGWSMKGSWIYASPTPLC